MLGQQVLVLDRTPEIIFTAPRQKHRCRLVGLFWSKNGGVSIPGLPGGFQLPGKPLCLPFQATYGQKPTPRVWGFLRAGRARLSAVRSRSRCDVGEGETERAQASGPLERKNRQLDGSVHVSFSAGSAPGRRVQKGARWVFLKIWGSHK